MKLTATTVRTLTLPEGKRDVIFFCDDLPGFGLRLREQGSRTFVYQYAIGEKQRRMALGAATALTVGEARETARRLCPREARRGSGRLRRSERWRTNTWPSRK
jgi:hypothetical protein